MQLTVQKLTCESDAEIVAGSLSCGDNSVAVGTYSGWQLYSASPTRCIGFDDHLLPKNCHVVATQFSATGSLLLVGTNRLQSFDRPGDWQMKLYERSRDGRVQVLCELPPGAWNAIPAPPGNDVELHDRGSDQGLLRVSRGTVLKHVRHNAFHKVTRVDDGFVGFDADALTFLNKQFEIQQVIQRHAPHQALWTAAASHNGSIVLGGFQKDPTRYVLGVLNGSRPEIVSSCDFRAVFDDAIAPNPFEVDEYDEDPQDIHHIAGIVSLQDRGLVLGLGGLGAGLGAAYGSAGAVAYLPAPDASVWESEVVDPNDGVSGMSRLNEGTVVVETCGDLHLASTDMGFASEK